MSCGDTCVITLHGNKRCRNVPSAPVGAPIENSFSFFNAAFGPVRWTCADPLSSSSSTFTSPLHFSGRSGLIPSYAPPPSLSASSWTQTGSQNSQPASGPASFLCSHQQHAGRSQTFPAEVFPPFAFFHFQSANLQWRFASIATLAQESSQEMLQSPPPVPSSPSVPGPFPLRSQSVPSLFPLFGADRKEITFLRRTCSKISVPVLTAPSAGGRRCCTLVSSRERRRLGWR